MFSWDKIWVFTKPSQKDAVLAHVPDIIKSNILTEPCPKGTAAAIAWATAKINVSQRNSVIAVLPSDHLIENEEEFRHSLDAGLSFAESHSSLVTFGIKPSRAESAYGYIEIGKLKTKVKGRNCYDVLAFHEKPDTETALKYTLSKTFFWNSGIFVFSSTVLFESLKKWLPSIWRPLEYVRSSSDSFDKASVARRYYNLMPDCSLDTGLFEKSSNIVVFPCDFGWRDMGVWETYYDLLSKDRDGNAVEGIVAPVECKKCLLMSDSGILIAALGIENMVIAAEGDIVLVCPRHRLGEIKRIIDKVKREGFWRYL
jgi:mannose-1-phosphate guanylyltransferase